MAERLGSVLIIIEPMLVTSTPSSCVWRAIGMVDGEILHDATYLDRAVALDDCLCALAAKGLAGIDREEDTDA